VLFVRNLIDFLFDEVKQKQNQSKQCQREDEGFVLV